MIEVNDVLLSPEQLQQHGIIVAENHRLSPKGKKATCLRGRLKSNYNEIFSIYKKLNEDNQEGVDLDPACEWLLDNFYIIENQVKSIEQSLKREQCEKFSLLKNKTLKGMPRIYVLALELVSHTDARIDEQLIKRFIKAYQTRKTLSIVELWALPLMLNIACIETIYYIARNIEDSQEQHRMIKKWQELKPDLEIETIQKYLEGQEKIHPILAEYIVRRSRENKEYKEKLEEYLQEKIDKWEGDVEGILQQSYHQQARRKVSIGNAIMSLHTIPYMDWTEVVEEISIVDGVLRQDPTGTYGKMDIESRDYYRQNIETIAKKCRVSERYVAKKVIECAQGAVAEEKMLKRQHVGFYILDHGREQLYTLLGKGKKDRKKKPLSLYTLPIVLLTIILAIFLGAYGYAQYMDTQQSTINGVFMGIFVIAMVTIPLSDMIIHLYNSLQIKSIQPKFIPKLALEEGIGEENATLIVIPTLLTNSKGAEEIIHQLEVHYLANREEHFYFAIAGDFVDASEEDLPRDKEIIESAKKTIIELNDKYSNNPFYFFHRHRTYNKEEDRWMGWERKRGALLELNELIRGKKDTSYSYIIGDINNLPPIEYIITLDRDTRLPIEEAKKLVGAIAHPLHIPIINENKGRVVDGYGLIQPRISLNIESVNGTMFSRFFAGQGGIDPYSTAVSDIYQDIFGEGIFTGKGIYHIDTFQKCLGNRMPTNAILSHDLLEGSYIRVGLASDIQLIDSFPITYSAYMARLHRWVRGDWQLLPWLAHRISNNKGERVENPINALSKWKIIDNLRRSLVSIFTLFLIIFGVVFFPGNVLIWVAIPLLSIFFPMIINLVDTFSIRHLREARKRFNGNMAFGWKASIIQGLLSYVFLAHHATQMMDAIIRTLYRINISKQNMLQWTTAAEAEKKLKNDGRSYGKRMKEVFIVVGLFILLTLVAAPDNLLLALLLCLPWIASPWIAYRVSQENPEQEEELRKEDKETLGRLGRKIWAYYEDLAGEAENYLPPDNFQVNPPNEIAHRTSPTNIGFLFMAILSARDFGYISTLKMIEKTMQTLSTVKRMETWQGHLYNWYNTQTVEVLSPHYVSTVDSGNFIAYLITLKMGLQEYLQRNLIGLEQVEGLGETLRLSKTRDFRMMKTIRDQMERKFLTLDEWIDLLEKGGEAECDDTYWKGKFHESIMEHRKTIQKFFPLELQVQSQSQSLKELKEEVKKPLDDLQKNNSLLDLEKTYQELKKIFLEIDSQKVESLAIDMQGVLEGINNSLENIQETKESIYKCIEDIDRMVEITNFSQLYNRKRQLFSIGYNAQEEKLTDSYYDLLASEARVVSYLAIVQGKIPKKHWFKLGRALTKIKGYQSLVSWTGTMFEYFMPPLIMKNFDNTLLSETYKTVVVAQMKYGKERKVPWGTSESGYYAFDLSLNYQYKAFGVPELGLKRGLKTDMVVSPYSSLLALPFAQEEAMDNIYELLGGGLEGQYGFYEAVDYTLKRLPIDDSKMIIKSFMAHHQGMSIMVLNNVLHGNIMEERFHSHPMVRAGESLLQEKVPLGAITTKEYKDTIEPMEREEGVVRYNEIKRVIEAKKGQLPHCHILTNGSYKIMITNEGTGYSAKGDLQVTRWRQVKENYGFFIFLRNLANNELWSTTQKPVGKEADNYEVIFSEDKAEFIRRDGNIESHTEIVVVPEESVEIRKLTLTNHELHAVELEVTSYTELVLTNQSADVAHPTFSNLFVRTERMKKTEGIIASRRPREEKEDSAWSFHTMSIEGQSIGNLQYETARNKFIGRGRTLSSAVAFDQPLGDSQGAVLDPIISLRKKVKIAAQSSVVVVFVNGIAPEKDQALLLGEKFQDLYAVEQAFKLAKIRNEIQLGNVNMSHREIVVYQDLMSHILFLSPLRRKYVDLLIENNQGQSKLWSYGISGDIPIVLISVATMLEIDIAQQAIKAHQYWQMKGLPVDIVILNEDESSYYQPMEELIKETIFRLGSGHLVNHPAGIFVLNAATLPREDILLLYSVARLAFKGEEGTIASQLKAIPPEEDLPPIKEFIKQRKSYPPLEKEKQEELFFYNGYGGFVADGSEYVIELKKDMQTPAPWINVISNPDFGFQVSENGAGFIWAENSRENKITAWSNDPTSDPPGEILYIRDEEDGSLWTPTPLPIREQQDYTIRHGWGYSEFHHDSHGIHQKLKTFVPLEDPLKISILRVHNHSDEVRQITATYYIKPVLGVSPEDTQPFLSTQWDKDRECLFIQNSYQSDYPGAMVGLACSEPIASYSGDNEEFMGEKGDARKPAALKREGLSKRIGAGFLACGAIQIAITLQPNEEKDINFLVGYGRKGEDLNEIITQYKDRTFSKTALDESKNYWKNLLGKIQVSTPDVSMDYLLNGWLLYQSISCRLWARSAFYQSGGAYGYRDQLQDTMNILPIFPQATREQILINSAHQFLEGDVQHWWHPGPGDKGIRTRFSDDLLWLPLTVAEYIEQTQDYSILDEVVPFLEDEPLKEGEDERYGIPRISEEEGSVYEHCIRAIDRSLKFGEHGIPLMGSGDWNDGMNTVGNKGKGESVWMGWFLYLILHRYSPLCEYKKDTQRAAHYRETAETMLQNLEDNAWDGDWYKRAYFDDGTPLGSIENDECRIDSLAQSWSVISGGASKERSKQAMKSVEQNLVKQEEGLILLFTPPFDEGELHPGYIKGYLPGVRENGGQYTHGATWVINALAMMGEGDKAMEYFNLINPINHSRTQIECATYKVEPYVMAADVYAVSPHVGRGGWTWYTGAAGWMYTVGLKYILGVQPQGEKLFINPCIPKEWKEYTIQYRYQDSLYQIRITNPQGVNKGVKEIKIDGEKIEEKYIPLREDKSNYKVEVILG